MKEVSQERMTEIVEQVEDLNDELAEIVHQLSGICREVGDGNARAYLIAPLEIIVEAGSWMSRDLTLPQWIERLRDYADGGEEYQSTHREDA